MINLEPHSAHERACHMHGKLKTSKEIWRHSPMRIMLVNLEPEMIDG